jgi:hypothetical protein
LKTVWAVLWMVAHFVTTMVYHNQFLALMTVLAIGYGIVLNVRKMRKERR